MANPDNGDFNLFVDDDGTGYVIYNAHIQGGSPPYHLMSVDKLSADYTASAGVTSGFFGASNVEVR
jgi:hypothetical protein